MLPIDKELKPEMSTLTQSTEFVRRSLTLAVAMSAICAAGVAVMSAQTPAAAPPAQGQVTAPLVNFNAYATLPAAFAATSDSSSSSSSADAATEASITTVDPLHLNAMQYGGRQRYGKPRYRGGNTNPDGSNRWMAYGGGGLSQPSGNTWKYFTPSWGLQAGVGRQFSYRFALPVEFDYDNFGLTKQTLVNQFTLYNNQINYYCNQNPATCVADGVSDFSSLDGNAHVWSFSFQPTYTLFHPGGDGLGAYVLAGAGFYHKVTNFTTPALEEYCDYYYGCGEYEANEIVDHYTSNAPGFDGGIGFTYKPSHFSGLRFYAEGRYVVVLNSQRTGVTVASPVNSTTIAATNDFPANSNRTTYFPVKFGVRF